MRWMVVGCAMSIGCGVTLDDPGAAGPARLDLGAGTVSAPVGFTALRTGTADSEMGVITAPDDAVVVSYDIGVMAGTRMHAGRRAECTWFDLQVDGPRARMSGLVGGEELVVTWTSRGRPGPAFPANFWARVDSEAERDLVLGIAASYAPRAPTQARNVRP